MVLALATHNIQKRAAEIINFSLDFEDVLQGVVGSPSLQSVVHTVVDIPNGDAVAGIVDVSRVRGTAIEFQVTNGVDRTEYLITFTVTLSDGQVLQESIKLLVIGC